MESSDIPWTENVEIEAYQAGNTMLDIIGYIDCMDSLCPVKTQQKFVFKIMLNNNKGSKVRVNFWRQAAVDWSKKLRLHQIVEITGCTVSDVKFQYDRDLKGVIANQELHFQEFSAINFLGTFDVASSLFLDKAIQYLKVPIHNCLEHTAKLIAVSGYVKDEFVVFRTIGEMALAYGNIADGKYRLCVQIHGYKNSDTSPLEKGLYATFQGEIDTSKPGAAFLKVQGMQNIIVDKEIAKLPLQELRLAIYPPPVSKPDVLSPPKRSAENDKENSEASNEKKMKED